MKRAFQFRIGSAFVVAMTAASAAIASPTSEWRYIGEFQPAVSSAGLSTQRFQPAAGLGTRFDSSAWDGGSNAVRSTTSSALTLDAQTTSAADASTSDPGGRRRPLGASTPTSNTSPVVGSPAALDLTLWNFVTSIKAQQVGNSFVQLQTSAANIDYTLNGVPAPVPIPQSFWLFAGGLAALAIARRWFRAGSTLRGLSSLPTT